MNQPWNAGERLAFEPLIFLGGNKIECVPAQDFNIARSTPLLTTAPSRNNFGFGKFNSAGILLTAENGVC